MAYITWDGSEGTTAWETGANWSGGSVPSGSSHILIPDTSSLDNPTLDQNRSCASLTIAANGTIVGAGYTLIVGSEGDASNGTEHYAVDNDGIISGNLDLTINTPATTLIDLNGSSGNFRTVTIGHASCVATLTTGFQCTTLNISLGQLDLDGAGQLTVTGTTTIGPDSGAAGQATLDCTDVVVSLGTGKTDGKGLHVRQGGTFVGGSGAHTMGSLVVDNNANAHFTNTTATNTINGHSNDSTRSILVGAECTAPSGGVGLINLTYGSAANIECGNGAAILNLTLTGNVTYTCSALLSITGSLTITSGTTLTTGSNQGLTVIGTTQVTGTLTCNGSTVSLGAAVTSGYGVTMAASGTFNGNAAAVTMGSIGPSSVTCTVNFSSVTTTFTSRNTSASNHITHLGGNTTFSMSSGEMIITTAAAGGLYLDPYGDNVFDLTINNGGNTVSLLGTLDVDRNLTITAGTLDTGSDQALTVTGTITVNSPSNTANLSINDSAVSCAKLIVESADTITAAHSSNALTITGTGIGDNRSCDFTGVISGTLNIITTHTGTREDDFSASSGIINHLTVNHADAVVKMNAAATLGDLTITAGTFDTEDGGGSDKALTAGHVNIATAGKLDLNNSVTILKSLTCNAGIVVAPSSASFTIIDEKSGFALYLLGDYTFTHSNGLVHISHGSHNSDTYVQWGAGSGKRLYDFKYTGYDADNKCEFYGYNDHLEIENDLTVAEGIFARKGDQPAETMTVTRDVVINSGGVLGATTDTGANTFGSFSIASGGTYIATSGLTNITAPYYGDHILWNNAGTFTHNNGTVKFTNDSYGNMGSGGDAFYNLISAVEHEGFYGLQILDDLVVLNNLTIDEDAQISVANGHPTIHGNVYLNGTWSRANLSTRVQTIKGTLTIGSSGYYRPSNGTNNLGGIRNLGGTIITDNAANSNVQPTINIVGTGGLIEGNLGQTNVNVNLDPVLDFDGVNDYVKIAGHADLDFEDGDFTIAGWVKGWATGGGAMYLFDNRESGNVNEPAIYWSSPNVVYYGNDGVLISSPSFPCSADDWNHIAVTRASERSQMYINGVAIGSDVADTTDYDASGNTIGVNIGKRYTAAAYLDGSIADFRIYKGEALSQPNIAILASKINGDSTLGAGTTNLKVWLKSNEGTGTSIVNAQGTSATNGVAVGSPAWAFDAFSVDVQDNTTTMSHVDVVQGVLNPKGLTSVNLDGTGDHIILANNNIETKLRTSHTFSGWIKTDDGDPSASYVVIGQNSSNGQNRFLLYLSAGQKLTWLYNAAGNAAYAEPAVTQFVDGVNPWHHFVITMKYNSTSSATMKLYLDGIEVTLDSTNAGAFGGNMADYDSTHPLMFGAENNGGGDRYNFDGNLRDFRFYDYALSADQTASLYSGSYNVTPYHWYKMDDGSTTTASDTGTATAVDATLTEFASTAGSVSTASDWNSGTINVEGMRVLGNGKVN